MDIFKSNVVVGVAAALAATVMAPVLIPIVAGAGRPLAKSLIKGGMLLYEKSREAVAEAGEAMEDLMAEVRAEEAIRETAPGMRPNPEPKAPSEPPPTQEAVRSDFTNGNLPASPAASEEGKRHDGDGAGKP